MSSFNFHLLNRDSHTLFRPLVSIRLTRFPQTSLSFGSLHISFQLSPVHSFSRPHGPPAPSTSHSSSALSILSPGHTVLWLPPHLSQAQPCPFFLQATQSSGSLHISFQLSPVHSFSRPHGPLAPSTSHSSSALSILSPGHTVLWLPPHLIPAQPCPFFLQATRSSGSLHISFKLSPVHYFSRPHGPLAPSTSKSSSALSILSPGHTVLWLPPHLIPAQPCPFFPQTSLSLWLPPHLSQAQSCPFFPQTPLSLWLPPHLSQAQPCPFFPQTSLSLWLDPHLSQAQSCPFFPQTPLSLWLPPHLSQAQSCPFFPQTSLSLWLPPHLSQAQSCPFFPQTPLSLWLPPHLSQAQPCPFFPQTSLSLWLPPHLSQAQSCPFFPQTPLSLWLPPHLSQAQPCPFFLQTILSLWLPPHLSQAQPCPFFLQTILSLWLPPHLSQAQSCPFFPQTSLSLWLPPHLSQAQSCPFLYIVQPRSCWCSS